MNIHAIGDCVLDETSSQDELRAALNAFALLCGDITDIRPDPSFDAWAEDSLLENGVAINPQAAAQCVLDYQRTVTYIRGIYAAIGNLKILFPDTPLEILYAGCGPFATLLLPMLAKFRAGELNIYLLDIHQRSLDSAELLLSQFGLCEHPVHTIKADACHYRHPGKLHLVIAETMQKSLEQEPQFAVTANLAHQLLPTGIFIPQNINVTLSLANLEYEKKMADQPKNSDPKNLEKRYPLATVFNLSPKRAADQMQNARHHTLSKKLELNPITVVIPSVAGIARLDAALFTHITVFEEYCLGDYESEITLPLKCHELAPLTGGEHFRVSYQLGNYPRFNFERRQAKR